MTIVQDIRAIVDTTRVRLTLNSVETYFFLMSALATVGMFFKIIKGMGKNDPFELQHIFLILGSFCLAIVLGLLIFFTAMLSIYYDDAFKLENSPIYSSNFIFTRLVTPLLRALILFVSLTFFLYSVTLF
jgi:uncharacterized membrane protein